MMTIIIMLEDNDEQTNWQYRNNELVSHLGRIKKIVYVVLPR